MATVKVTINPKTGEKQYDINGVVGGACDDLTRALRENNEELEYQQTAEYCEQEERPDWLEQEES